MTETTDRTLYHRLGAEAGIAAAVDEFYRRVLADPGLEHYFAGVDVARLRRHQVLFLSTATGGPSSYHGTDMPAAHARLGVTGDHFDRVVQHLVDALAALGVSDDLITEVGSALMPLRSEIVSA